MKSLRVSNSIFSELFPSFIALPRRQIIDAVLVVALGVIPQLGLLGEGTRADGASIFFLLVNVLVEKLGEVVRLAGSAHSHAV